MKRTHDLGHDLLLIILDPQEGYNQQGEPSWQFLIEGTNESLATVGFACGADWSPESIWKFFLFALSEYNIFRDGQEYNWMPIQGLLKEMYTHYHTHRRISLGSECTVRFISPAEGRDEKGEPAWVMCLIFSDNMPQQIAFSEPNADYHRILSDFMDEIRSQLPHHIATLISGSNQRSLMRTFKVVYDNYHPESK